MNALTRLRLYEIAALTAAALQLSLAGCAFSPPGYAQQKTNHVPFVTVEKGYNSGVRERKFLVIKTETEWKDLWQAHLSVTVPPKALPSVDFQSEMVVAVFSGEKPSGGYRIEVTKITEDPQKRQLVVSLVETKPPAGAMVTAALTQPHYIVKLKKTDLPVTFAPQQ